MASDTDRDRHRDRVFGHHELHELAAHWDRLAARSGSPMDQFIWARACADVLADRYSLHVVAVGPPERPAAIAPLARLRRPLAPLELLGVRELREPMGFLYEDDEAAARLVEALVSTRAPLSLKRFPGGPRLLSQIVEAYRQRGVVLTRDPGGCPFIRLTDRHLHPELVLTSRRRSDLQRAQRRAEGLGEVTHEILTPSPGELQPLLEAAFRVESASWKGRARTALSHDPLRRAFYGRYAAAACAKGMLRLCFLRIGEARAAMQLAVETGGRFWLLKVGYDERFARCSPGTLLLAKTIRYAAATGLRSYELLGHQESWTRPWAADAHRCVRLDAYPFEARGVGALASDAATIGGRRLREAVRGRG
jgi:CelD/BcsL family acetyltransferase involved in cellulose biosynthesis